MSGWDFYGNTMRNCSTGVLLGGGRDNHIHDNIFIDNDRDIAFDNRGMNWQAKCCQIDCDPATGTSCFHAGLVALNYTNPRTQRPTPRSSISTTTTRAPRSTM